MTDYNVTVGKDLLPGLLSSQDGLAKLIENILITSPIVTGNKINRLISCIKKAPETIVVVDQE